MASWFDDNQRTAPQPQQPGGFTPLSAVGGGGGLYQPMIAEMFRRVSGGTYTPTQQDIAQFGANPDPQYLQKIGPAIQQWWDANKGQNPTGAQPGTVYGPSAPYQPPPAPGGTVLLRAPNGQTKAVPADQVNFYLARGATRI